MSSKKKMPPSVRLAMERVRARAAARSVTAFSIPRVVMKKDELRGLGLDARAETLLASIDGETGVQALVDLTGLRKVDVVSILEDLLRRGVIEIG